MARMYGLEMLCHKTDGRPSTKAELTQVDVQYPWNDHGNAVLNIGPHFFEPVEDDMPTNLENARETSDVDEDEIEMDELPLNVQGPPTPPLTAMED